ncbi:leucine-rich repeat domain-containing protein [Prevotella sp. S7 MS 2]|uniref:leucine-rich repeat domain-containing protein n=1 Tax=Prevotella sp. S7 MS 2 TaxID=1287488 RepID=UPI0007832499|nr:leucine-rich repeat domain-containing protein [Prevotella sp. S7 MS 2]
MVTLVLPDALTEIESQALSNNSRLKKVVFGEKLQRIGEYAFSSCGSLEDINLPKSLTKLGKGAFAVCPITDLRVAAITPPAIDESTFHNLKYANCKLTIDKDAAEEYAAHPLWKPFTKVTTGINDVVAKTEVKEVARYTLDGKRATATTKGIQIIKMSDGSTKKVIVK